jgi:hypothetical protein
MKAKKTSASAKKKRPGRTSRPRRAISRAAAPARLRRRATKAKPPVKTKRVAARRKAAKRKKPAPKAPAKLPPFLLEGDQPEPLPVSGPGEKFALGVAPSARVLEPEAADLPEAYGTQRLFLTARDPHWLYATWDLTRAQQSHYNARSADRHLILRIYSPAPAGQPVSEIQVHPESRHWFAHVECAGTKYAAELGYYRPDRKWTPISSSGPALTPPDAVSPDTAVEFATIPAAMPFTKLAALVKAAGLENAPLARAVEELRRHGHPELPPIIAAPFAALTPAHELALAEAAGLNHPPDLSLSSLEFAESLRPAQAREVAAPEMGQFDTPTSPTGVESGVSSLFGGQPGPKGFWLNVNAELVVYGATEADATVMIAGRAVKLRPDGSFSCRFALPDGEFELPVSAISADQTDGRAAELKFSRQTGYCGEVGALPQDPKLKPPAPENV